MTQCRVAQAAEDAAMAAKTLQSTLRKLKALQTACESCPNGFECQIAAAWSNRLDQAVRDVAEEWGLI